MVLSEKQPLRIDLKIQILLKSMLPSNLGRRVATNAFWSLFGEILAKGLIFLSFITVARILGKDGYGQFGILRTTITMFAIFGGMGLGLTANKFVAQNREKNRQYSGEIIGMANIIAIISGLIVSTVVLLASHYICTDFLKAPQLETELRLSALILLFSAINGSQIGTLQGLEAYQRLAFSSFIQGISAFPLFFAGTWFWGLIGAIIAYALNIIIYTIALQLILNRELKRQGITVSYEKITAHLPIVWKFSLPAALTGIAVSPFKWLSEALLVKHAGFSELGIFQASMVVITVLISISSTVNAPLISIAANSDNFDRSKKMQFITIFSSWYLFLLMAIPFLVFPKLLILFFGQKFNDPHLFSANLLLILYCGMLMYYQGLMRVIILNNSMWFAFITNMFEGLTLITAFILFKKLGAIGLGYAYVSSYLVRILISVPFILKLKLIPAKVLFDKYFIITFILLFSIIAIILKIRG
jgi:O-antigen/teichoic acid export membrane protein